MPRYNNPTPQGMVKQSTMYTDAQFENKSDFPAFKGVIEPAVSYYSRKVMLNPEFKTAQFDIPCDFPKSQNSPSMKESPKFGQFEVIERQLEIQAQEKQQNNMLVIKIMEKLDKMEQDQLSVQGQIQQINHKTQSEKIVRRPVNMEAVSVATMEVEAIKKQPIVIEKVVERIVEKPVPVKVQKIPEAIPEQVFAINYSHPKFSLVEMDKEIVKECYIETPRVSVIEVFETRVNHHKPIALYDQPLDLSHLSIMEEKISPPPRAELSLDLGISQIEMKLKKQVSFPKIEVMDEEPLRKKVTVPTISLLEEKREVNNVFASPDPTQNKLSLAPHLLTQPA